MPFKSIENMTYSLEKSTLIYLVSGGLLLRHFLLFCNKEAPSTLYKGNRSSEKVPEHFRSDKQQQWIVKSNQRRCAMRGCSGTSQYSCKNGMLGWIQNVLKGAMFNKEKICTSDIVALWTLSCIHWKTTSLHVKHSFL